MAPKKNSESAVPAPAVSPIKAAPSSPAASPARAAAPSSNYQAKSANELNLASAFASDAVQAAYAARQRDLNGLGEEVKRNVALLEAAVQVDASFDDSELRSQLAALFPTCEEAGIVAPPASAPYDFAILKGRLEAIRRRSDAVPPKFKSIFSVLIKRTEAAVANFEGTTVNNRPCEAAFVTVLDSVLTLIENYMSIAIPDTETMHNAAQENCRQAKIFEERRVVEDWVPELIREEATIYDENARILATADDMRAQANAALDAVQAFNLNSGAAYEFDDGNLRASKEELDRQRRDLEKKEAEEKATFKRLLDKTTGDAKAAASEAARCEAASHKLAEQIRALTDQLVASQCAMFAAQQRASILTQAAAALTSRYEADEGSERLMIATITQDLKDAEATLKARGLAGELIKDTTGEVDKSKSATAAEFSDAIHVIGADECKLVTAAYYKKKLALFAADARIHMKEQQREAVLVKKKRSNAAQDTAGVEECNRNVVTIEGQIQQEEDNKRIVEGELKTLFETFGAIYSSFGRSLANAALKAEVPGYKKDFDAMLAKLTAVEKETASKVDLADVLDSVFLNNSLDASI